MVERVKRWLADGHTIKIMTARVRVFNPKTNLVKKNYCRIKDEQWSRDDMVQAIQAWCEKHVGARLPVTCVKDVDMIELWDDRAVQVVPNTGRTLAEEHAAELSALKGAP